MKRMCLLEVFPMTRQLGIHMVRSAVFVAALATGMALSACGGGAGSAPAAVAQPMQNPNAAPVASPYAGDYFVYDSLDTPSLPAGSAPTDRTLVRDFKIVNADGSLTRVETFSTFTSFSSIALASSGAVVTWASGNNLCTYSPALMSSAPRASMVGDAYTATSTLSCAIQPAGAPTTTSLSLQGTVVSVEQLTIPLGTFSTFKYSQTTIATGSSATTTWNETTWLDMQTGRTVQSSSTYSTVPNGQSNPSATGTTLFRLVAYSFHGQAPVGSAVRRFSGYWNVIFSGTGQGKCDNLLIDSNGGISGTCQSLTSVGLYSVPFSITGYVDQSGNASVTAATGAVLSGAFTSPTGASGSWTNGSASGTWTGVHV